MPNTQLPSQLRKARGAIVGSPVGVVSGSGGGKARLRIRRELARESAHESHAVRRRVVAVHKLTHFVKAANIYKPVFSHFIGSIMVEAGCFQDMYA
jgi:hypothetical protein